MGFSDRNDASRIEEIHWFLSLIMPFYQFFDCLPITLDFFIPSSQKGCEHKCVRLFTRDKLEIRSVRFLCGSSFGRDIITVSSAHDGSLGFYCRFFQHDGAYVFVECIRRRKLIEHFMNSSFECFKRSKSFAEDALKSLVEKTDER